MICEHCTIMLCQQCYNDFKLKNFNNLSEHKFQDINLKFELEKEKILDSFKKIFQFYLFKFNSLWLLMKEDFKQIKFDNIDDKCNFKSQTSFLKQINNFYDKYIENCNNKKIQKN